jgi:hypothetical protein
VPRAESIDDRSAGILHRPTGIDDRSTGTGLWFKVYGLRFRFQIDSYRCQPPT